VGSAASSERRGIKAIFRPKASGPADSVRDGPPAKVFWPHDYIADDIPEARVWTYGYNADTIGGVFAANNKNSVSQHGRDLSVKIEREVDNRVGDSLSGRGTMLTLQDPIVFVAQSRRYYRQRCTYSTRIERPRFRGDVKLTLALGNPSI
jgi:hypothetical protein